MYSVRITNQTAGYQWLDVGSFNQYIQTALERRRGSPEVIHCAFVSDNQSKLVQAVVILRPDLRTELHIDGLTA